MLQKSLNLLQHHYRAFSSFSRVQGGSISLSTHYPPKLRIPTGGSQQHFDVTLDEGDSVSQFEAKVQAATGDKHFKVIPPGGVNTVEQLLRQKFIIKSGRFFEVYPQLETMVDKPVNKQNRELLDQILEGRSIPISRRVILTHYIDQVLKSVQGASLTQAQITAALNQALAQYATSHATVLYANPLMQLRAAQEELAKLEAQGAAI
jgi:hypothetical protein